MVSVSLDITTPSKSMSCIRLGMLFSVCRDGRKLEGITAWQAGRYGRSLDGVARVRVHHCSWETLQREKKMLKMLMQLFPALFASPRKEGGNGLETAELSVGEERSKSVFPEVL
ncbi:hypothetical protein AV530_004060 [Patagioenas fasciata monilis]|uniref:Uncharacterized protein n=1 Tax=Patagioenas fasciata monilis TaxID=372326 RepID=A0A1V4JTL7_PATFA|nr:hypothetical protein AV530_004060 [Patagioenas fasciata monilis]